MKAEVWDEVFFLQLIFWSLVCCTLWSDFFLLPLSKEMSSCFSRRETPRFLKVAWWAALLWDVQHYWCWRRCDWHLTHTNYISFWVTDRYQPREGCLDRCADLTVYHHCPPLRQKLLQSHWLDLLCLSWGLGSHLHCCFGCIGSSLHSLTDPPFLHLLCLLSPVLVSNWLGCHVILSHNIKGRCQALHGHCCKGLLSWVLRASHWRSSTIFSRSSFCHCSSTC